jgi:hypothetical protein
VEETEAIQMLLRRSQEKGHKRVWKSLGVWLRGSVAALQV